MVAFASNTSAYLRLSCPAYIRHESLELILGYGIIDIQGEEIHVLATGGRTHPLPSLKLRQTKPAP
jgi:hypothetical protein